MADKSKVSAARARADAQRAARLAKDQDLEVELNRLQNKGEINLQTQAESFQQPEKFFIQELGEFLAECKETGDLSLFEGTSYPTVDNILCPEGPVFSYKLLVGLILFYAAGRTCIRKRRCLDSDVNEKEEDDEGFGENDDEVSGGPIIDDDVDEEIGNSDKDEPGPTIASVMMFFRSGLTVIRLRTGRSVDAEVRYTVNRFCLDQLPQVVNIRTTPPIRLFLSWEELEALARAFVDPTYQSATLRYRLQALLHHVINITESLRAGAFLKRHDYHKRSTNLKWGDIVIRVSRDVNGGPNHLFIYFKCPNGKTKNSKGAEVLLEMPVDVGPWFNAPFLFLTLAHISGAFPSEYTLALLLDPAILDHAGADMREVAFNPAKKTEAVFVNVYNGVTMEMAYPRFSEQLVRASNHIGLSPVATLQMNRRSGPVAMRAKGMSMLDASRQLLHRWGSITFQAYCGRFIVADPTAALYRNEETLTSVNAAHPDRAKYGNDMAAVKPPRITRVDDQSRRRILVNETRQCLMKEVVCMAEHAVLQLLHESCKMRKRFQEKFGTDDPIKMDHPARKEIKADYVKVKDFYEGLLASASNQLGQKIDKDAADQDEEWIDSFPSGEMVSWDPQPVCEFLYQFDLSDWDSALVNARNMGTMRTSQVINSVEQLSGENPITDDLIDPTLRHLPAPAAPQVRPPGNPESGSSHTSLTGFGLALQQPTFNAGAFENEQRSLPETDAKLARFEMLEEDEEDKLKTIGDVGEAIETIGQDTSNCVNVAEPASPGTFNVGLPVRFALTTENLLEALHRRLFDAKESWVELFNMITSQSLTNADLLGFRPGHAPLPGNLCRFCNAVLDMRNDPARTRRRIAHVNTCAAAKVASDHLDELLLRYPSHAGLIDPLTGAQRDGADVGKSWPVIRIRAMIARELDVCQKKLKRSKKYFEIACHLCDSLTQHYTTAGYSGHLLHAHGIYVPPNYLENKYRSIETAESIPWTADAARFERPVWHTEDLAYHYDPRELSFFCQSLIQNRILGPASTSTGYGIRNDIDYDDETRAALSLDHVNAGPDSKYQGQEGACEYPTVDHLCVFCVNDPFLAFADRGHRSDCPTTALATRKSCCKKYLKRINDIISRVNDGEPPLDSCYLWLADQERVRCPDAACHRLGRSFDDTLHFVWHLAAVHFMQINHPTKQVRHSLKELTFDDDDALVAWVTGANPGTKARKAQTIANKAAKGKAKEVEDMDEVEQGPSKGASEQSRHAEAVNEKHDKNGGEGSGKQGRKRKAMAEVSDEEEEQVVIAKPRKRSKKN